MSRFKKKEMSVGQWRR